MKRAVLILSRGSSKMSQADKEVFGIHVTIDRNGCVSCGTCWDTCPAFFEQNPDDSFSQVITGFRPSENPAEGIVPEDLETCVSEAVDLCPVQIISIRES